MDINFRVSQNSIILLRCPWLKHLKLLGPKLIWAYIGISKRKKNDKYLQLYYIFAHLWFVYIFCIFTVHDGNFVNIITFINGSISICFLLFFLFFFLSFHLWVSPETTCVSPWDLQVLALRPAGLYCVPCVAMAPCQLRLEC